MHINVHKMIDVHIIFKRDYKEKDNTFYCTRSVKRLC